MARSKAPGPPWRVGFDLGGTKMLAAVYDAEYRQVGRARKKTKAAEGRKAGLARIVRTIEAALADAGVEDKDLAGIGVGSPGPLDLNRGVILETPNLGWRDVPLRKTLADRFGCPVAVANDVDAGTYGEYRFGAARGARCAIGVFPGTGIGGACVYEGRILRGARLSCMEIGHMKVAAGGPLCGCGRRGCLETVASRLAVAAQAAAAAHRGDAPHLAESAGTDLANVRSGALAAAVASGDAVVETLLRDAASHVGLAVSNVINLLAPDVVVLGGGLVEAMPDLFVEACRERAEAEVMAPFRGTFRVAAAERGDDAAVMGAAALAGEEPAGKAGARGKAKP